VSVDPLQDAAAHVVVPVGYTHAPDPLQSVAPQVPPVVHAAEQHWPVPDAPQTPVVHWLSAPHAMPAATLGTQAPEVLQ
jgi:hypothetical protein